MTVKQKNCPHFGGAIGKEKFIMLKKKAGILALGALVLGGLASCGSQSADLVIWCPSNDQVLMQQIIEDFKTANPAYADKTIAIRGNYAEGETSAPLMADKTAAADVICMVDDNIRASVDANTLLDISDEKDAIVKSDGQGAVDACSIDGKLYGYPYRSDNAFMLIYNSEIVSDEQAKSVEGILAACKTASDQKGVDVKFHYNISEGWYGVSYFQAFGLGQDVAYDEDGVASITSDYYSSQGVQIADRAMELAQQYPTTWEMSIETATVESGFENGTVGAAIIWNDYNNILAKCPTAKVTTLPTLTVDSVTEQLVSFIGYKAMVVNNYVADPSRPEGTEELARAFARFATSKDAQEERISLGYGPSNLELTATITEDELPFVACVNEQAAAGKTVSQALTTTADFWTPLQEFGGYIKARSWGTLKTSRAALSALINKTGWEVYDFIDNGTVSNPAQ